MSFKSFIDSFAHGLGFGMLYGNPYLSCCSNPFMYNPYMCGSISLFAYPSINTMNFFPQTPVFSQPEFNFSFNTGEFNMPANYNTSQTGLFNFNFSNIGNTTNLSVPSSVRSSSNVGDTFTSTRSESVINANNNEVKNIDWWKKQGYNEAKGKEFAKNAKMISDEMQRNHITGECVGGVRRAINKTFYNGETKYRLNSNELILSARSFTSFMRQFNCLNIALAVKLSLSKSLYCITALTNLRHSSHASFFCFHSSLRAFIIALFSANLQPVISLQGSSL